MKLEKNVKLGYGFYNPNDESFIFIGYFKNNWLRCYCENNNDIGYSFKSTIKSFNI